MLSGSSSSRWPRQPGHGMSATSVSCLHRLYFQPVLAAAFQSIVGSVSGGAGSGYRKIIIRASKKFDNFGQKLRSSTFRAVLSGSSTSRLGQCRSTSATSASGLHGVYFQSALAAAFNSIIVIVSGGAAVQALTTSAKIWGWAPNSLRRPLLSTCTH